MSRILGHAPITTKADVYGHVTPATLRRSAERMDEAWPVRWYDGCYTPKRRALQDDQEGSLAHETSGEPGGT